MGTKKAARTIVLCGLCSLILFAGCTPIPLPLAGEGSISAVDPAEGTVGTELTISGSNLGSVPGEVFVGTAKAQVRQWSETQIVARVAGPLSVGDYDVTVRPWWEEPVTFSLFSVRSPELNSLPFRPQFLSGGETMTVTGKWFSDEPGALSLENEQQERVAAEIVDWGMGSITFQVPAGLSGLWDLVASNSVGDATEPHWCTFEPCPAGASTGPVVEGDMPGNTGNTYDAPSAIQFEGTLWVFGPGSDDNIRANGYVNGNGSFTDMADPPGETYTQMAPLIVDGVLWLFNTARDGTIEYFKYNSTAKTWSSAVKVPNVSTNNKYPVGAAYNNADPYHRIEVFYYNNGKIYRTYTDNSGQAWSAPTAVISGANFGPSALFWANAVYWDSTNQVSIPLPFVTLVSYQTASTMQVDYVQDGRRLYSQTVYSVNGTMGGFHPYLLDLGEDYNALTFGDQNCQPTIRKMAKSTGKWESKLHPVAYTDYSACFNTTGAVGVTKVADTNSQGGYRYDTYFYIFWGKNNGKIGSQDYWVRTQVEYLGYYTEPQPPVPTDFASTEKDTFYLWPVLGIVDAPPFVANGVDIPAQDCTLYDCTRIEFKAGTTNTVQFGGSVSAGPYFETGEKCPVKLEVSAEVSHSVNTGTELSTARGDELERTTEGLVMVYYLTPEFETHTYEWFNHGSTETGKYFYVMEVIRNDVTAKTFAPNELPVSDALYISAPYWNSFPLHVSDTDAGRLATYAPAPTEPYYFSSSGDWARAKPGEIDWEAAKTTETTNGLDIQFKVGKGGLIGGGVEGSFTLHMTLTTTLQAGAITYLRNKDASVHGRDVDSFHVLGYWLRQDESAYWVPVNRQGMGDKPWFITYYVTYTPY